MRRIALIAALAGIAALAALAIGSSAQGSSPQYNVNVIFDDARGLIGGQLVKIAGAKAGTINSVAVVRQGTAYRAKVETTIDGPFRFRKDASCTIAQEGLIGENYVLCDPGSSSVPLAGNPPTVPVTQTTEPVSLLDLFNIFNLPTRERFQVIINELGVGTAGRGDDFNQILLRANPALALARQVISILSHQNRDLATIIDSTSTIAAEGAAHTDAVQRFIRSSASLLQQTAGHSSALSEAIARLPGLLTAANPALTHLDTVAKEGTPVLANIHTALPYLNAVDRDIGPFAAVAAPAIAAMEKALDVGIPAIKNATPLVKEINNYLQVSKSTTAQFSKLAKNLQQHGFFEGFFSVVYYVTAALSRYTSNGHLLSILLVDPNNGACSSYATKPVAGCSAHYGSQPAYTPARRGHRAGKTSSSTPSTAQPGSSTGQQPGSGQGSTGQTSTGQSTSTTPAPSPASGASSAVQKTGQALQNLVNYLLK
jgi:ABC-type transporter Mla subunit MlaD